jgi:tetratricopeptide (TPR) repeat protein
VKESKKDEKQFLQLLMDLLSGKDVSKKIQKLEEPFMSILKKYLGLIFESLGDYDGAKEYYRRSLDVARELNDKKGIAESLQCLGILQQNQGNYREAVKFYKESLDLFESLNHQEEIAELLHQMGLLHEEMKNYEKALEYQIKSLLILSEINFLDTETVMESLHYIRTIIGQRQFEHYWKIIAKEEVPEHVLSSFKEWLESFIQDIIELTKNGEQEEIVQAKEYIKEMLEETEPSARHFFQLLLGLLSRKDISREIKELEDPYRSILEKYL